MLLDVPVEEIHEVPSSTWELWSWRLNKGVPPAKALKTNSAVAFQHLRLADWFPGNPPSTAAWAPPMHQPRQRHRQRRSALVALNPWGPRANVKAVPVDPFQGENLQRPTLSDVEPIVHGSCKPLGRDLQAIRATRRTCAMTSPHVAVVVWHLRSTWP